MKKAKSYSEVRELPGEEMTGCGQKYNPRDMLWRLRTNSAMQSLNFGRIEAKVTHELMFNLKTVFIYRLRNQSIGGQRNILSLLIRALVVSDGECLGEIKLENLEMKTDRSLRGIPAFLMDWHELGMDGVSVQTYDQMKRIEKPKQSKGRIVKTYDPRKSALTAEESELMVSKLNCQYAAGRIKTEDYLIFAILLCSGARGIQVVSLRCSSLVGDVLKIPKVKTNTPLYRDTVDYKLSSKLAIWELLRVHVEQRIEASAGNENTPMFKYKSSHYLTISLKSINQKYIGIRSDRLSPGEIMPITPTRLRHTIATRMAEVGFGVFTIACTLGHENCTSCQVYIDATPARDKQISDAMSPPLQPYADAFLGKIIEDESQFPCSPDGSVKLDKRIELGVKATIGNCGKCGSCSARAPISCYTCTEFYPWEDAPHRELLDYVLREREETAEITKDPEVIKALDLTIRAVCYVIEECDKRKAEF